MDFPNSKTMTISLLHPSRGRPHQAKKAAESWFRKAGVTINYILSIDDDDDSEYVLPDCCNSLWYSQIVTNKNRSAIDAINNAAKVAKGDIFVVMSDDFEAPKDWALNILQATEGKKDWIVKTPDGIQKWIITLPIMDRDYYNRFGYVYYPEYQHMFCDTEMTCVADLTGRKIELDIPFAHNHYSTGKTQKDEVNERADKTWSQGEKLFIERYKKNFDLVNPVGKISSTEYLNWIKAKL